MARLLRSVNMLLAVMLLFVGISRAASYRKEQNASKKTLCSEYNGRCQQDMPILEEIIFYLNNEANALTEEKSLLLLEIKMLNREAKILRHRIEFPFEPAIDVPEVATSSVGVPLMNFEFIADDGENSCFALVKNCLEILGYIKDQINDLEAMKNDLSSEIVTMTKVRENLKKVVKDLQQQLNESTNDV